MRVGNFFTGWWTAPGKMPGKVLMALGKSRCWLRCCVGGMLLHERAQKGNGYGITDEQRQLVADGKIQEFWESRLAAGDPVARAGLASLNPEGGVVDYLFGGNSINNRLQAFANVYNDGVLNIGQVRSDLANAHIRFTELDTSGISGLLNPGQIAEYHHRVFGNHGLPPTTFSGTPFTGAVEEAWVTRPVWRGGCDWK